MYRQPAPPINKYIYLPTPQRKLYNLAPLATMVRIATTSIPMKSWNSPALGSVDPCGATLRSLLCILIARDANIVNTSAAAMTTPIILVVI